MKTKVNYLLALLVILVLGACDDEKMQVDRTQQMRDLVNEVARKAKGDNPDFLVLVQNAPELAFEDDGTLTDHNFLSEVDGFSGEWVFYNGKDTVAAERLAHLDRLKQAGKWILALDYVNSDDHAMGFMDSCINHEFVGYPRIAPIKDYKVIPTTTPNANSNHILQLSDAKNALVAYNPPAGSAAALLAQLQATDFDVLIIDPEYKDTAFTKDQVNALKVKANGGSRRVIAYLNLGAAERWRYYFKNIWIAHCPHWLRSRYGDGFKNEYYVKYWLPVWHEIIYSGDDPYIDHITAAGFDGVMLDNVEAFHIGWWGDKP